MMIKEITRDGIRDEALEEILRRHGYSKYAINSVIAGNRDLRLSCLQLAVRDGLSASEAVEEARILSDFVILNRSADQRHGQ